MDELDVRRLARGLEAGARQTRIVAILLLQAKRMVNALVFLYLASESRFAFLQKEVEFHSLPREGEWLKLRNKDKGDYFAFWVKEVTHREGGLPELMLDVLRCSETEYELFEEHELDEYIASYVAEGWLLKSCKENKLYINRAMPR